MERIIGNELPFANNVKLVVGDFRTICQELEPNSIDAVITDPPYGREYLSLYEDLAVQAQRLLKDGGRLIVMTGQTYLPTIMDLMSKHLNYVQMCCYYMPGAHGRMWHRPIINQWKPILCYVKGTNQWILQDDIFVSVKSDKKHHVWGQSESGITALVERFTEPNDLVLDPMAGGGTCAVVCRKLKRRFIGMDIDPEAIKATKSRIPSEVGD